MNDRKKVITALKFCTDTKPVETCFGKCPYAVADDDYRCRDMKLDALALLKEQQQQIWELQDQVEYLTDKQEGKKFLVDSDGKITPLPEIVRCKDCKWFHQAFKSEGRCLKHDNDYHEPGWFCADGERNSADEILMGKMDADPLG